MSEKGEIGTVIKKIAIQTCCNCDIEIRLGPNFEAKIVTLNTLPTAGLACLLCPAQQYCPELVALKSACQIADAKQLNHILSYVDSRKPLSSRNSVFDSGNNELHFEINSMLVKDDWDEKELADELRIFSSVQKSTLDGK